MRIAVFALGTRGDVQPFVQIAHDLETAGHDVRFATPPGMGALTRMLDHASVTEYGPDVSRFLNSDRGQRIILSGRTSWLMRELFALNNQHAAEIADTVDELSRGSDVIIGGSLSEEKTAAAAVRHSAALHSIHFAPFAKNSAVPHSLFNVRDLGTFGNRRTYDLFTALRTAASIDDVMRADDIAWSDRLSPRLIRAAAMTTTDAYSRHLIPDRVRGGHSRIDPVGFVHLSEDLRGRLSAGDDTDAAIEWIDGERTDVIYVGFGSMPVGDPTRLLSLLSMLAEGLDVRIVWCTGWSAESSRTVDPRILVVHEVDHTRLMARCAAVVHHGGAGTTAEAARAGKPQVIMPFFWDQPFWGRMVVEKNVGTCVRYTRATPRTVLTAVRTALSSKIRANAHTLAHRMRDETDAPPSEPPSVTCERYPSAPERRMCIGPHISLHRVPTTVPVTVLTHRPVADWSARSHMSAPPPEQRREGVEVVELEVHALDQRSDRRASTAAATSAAANRTPISLGVLKDQLRRLPRP